MVVIKLFSFTKFYLRTSSKDIPVELLKQAHFSGLEPAH